MRKQAFQEIAKHFAESIDVKLVFEEGAAPSTNGKTIILPTEMSEQYLDETLGALLHETSHIRYSEFSFFKRLDKLQMFVGNALEDIRVDFKALQQYPNSKCFYMSLIEDVLVRAKGMIDGEDLPVKKVKALILNSFGIEVKRVYGSDENFEAIETCVAELQGIMNQVVQCDKTTDIAPFIPIVIKKVFGEQPEPPKQQPQSGKGNPDKACNDGDGGESQDGEGEPSDDDRDSDSEQKDEPENDQDDSDSESEEKNDILEEYVEKMEEKTDTAKDAQEKADKVRETAEEFRRLERSRKTFSTKARKMASDIHYNGETAEKKEKLEHFQEKAEQRKQDVSAASQEYSKLIAEMRAAQNAMQQAEREFAAAQSKLNAAGFGQNEQCNLLGFNALDTEKLLDKNYVEVQYSPALDEIIKETLILKQEELQSEETGRINSRYLHEIYTEVENIFQEKEERKIKTRVSLVVDTSGSMDGNRTAMCLNAINIVANAFKKAVTEGAPGEMSLYVFSDDVKLIMDNIMTFQTMGAMTFRQLAHPCIGGGTNLAKAVNHVVTEVDGDPEFRNIIVIITDADVDQSEINKMTNNISTADARVMYIAVDGNFSYCQDAKELFGENNIKTMEDAPKIIEQVMFQGLQMVN